MPHLREQKRNVSCRKPYCTRTPCMCDGRIGQYSPPFIPHSLMTPNIYNTRHIQNVSTSVFAKRAATTIMECRPASHHFLCGGAAPPPKPALGLVQLKRQTTFFSLWPCIAGGFCEANIYSEDDRQDSAHRLNFQYIYPKPMRFTTDFPRHDVVRLNQPRIVFQLNPSLP